MGNLYCISNIGLEGISFTMTNYGTGEIGTAPEMLNVYNMRNCWVTNCEFAFKNQHIWDIAHTLGMWVFGNIFDNYNGTVGSGAGGMVFQDMSCCLFENNKGVSTGTSFIEIDGGHSDAFFGNYTTNCQWFIDNHGQSSHTLMMLLEANVTGDTVFPNDGYFASSSHWTIFRNAIGGGANCAIRINRWGRYMNIVGNVLGEYIAPGWWITYQLDEANPYQTNKPTIYELGMPNQGNEFFGGAAITNDLGPQAWDYPGASNYFSYQQGITIPYSAYTFTNTQGPTNVFTGPSYNTLITNYSTVLRLIWQAHANTNYYYTLFGGNGVVPTQFTSTNMTIDNSGGNFTVTNSDIMLVAGFPGWQAIQAADKLTHLRTGNWDYNTGGIVWDGNGPQNTPLSYLYTSIPAYWGTNPWPPVSISNTVTGGAMAVGTIPAEILPGTNSVLPSPPSIININGAAGMLHTIPL
jgi:hypothetical protein